MKNVILAGVSLAVIASGCTQLAVSKLQSADEAEWRTALVEIQKDDERFLNQNPMSGPEKLGRVAMNEAITYHYGSEVSYPLQVRKGAVDALGDMLASSAVYKEDGYKISELAFDQLVDIYAKIKDSKIRDEVIKVFDNPQGYKRLLDAPKDGYHGFRSDKSVANVLAACSDNRYSFMFDYYCQAGEVKQINLNNATSKEALSKGLDHNAAIENAPKLAGQAYVMIPNPTIEQSKRALVFCNKPDEELPYFMKDDKPSEAQILAATRVPEKDMRELLVGLRERDPQTYWFIWSKCATPDEALKVYNSKADDSKKLRAVGRLGDEKLLAEIANGDNDDFTIAAVRALHNTAVIAQIACDKRRDTKVRMSALERLVSKELFKANKQVDVRAVVDAMISFDHTMEFGDAYSNAVKGIEELDGQVDSLNKVKEVADNRARQIVEKGAAVKDGTFCSKGFRLGMYQWELKFLVRVLNVSGIGIETDIGDTLRGLKRALSNTDHIDYVNNLVFWGDGIRNVLEIDGTTVETVKDVFTEKYGDGGNVWDFAVVKDIEKGVVVHVKQNIDKQVAFVWSLGMLYDFFIEGRKCKIEKGGVFCNICAIDLMTDFPVPYERLPFGWRSAEREWDKLNCSAVVKQVVDGGVVVGSAKEIQRIRTGTDVNIRVNGPNRSEPVYTTYKFCNRIFVKTKGCFAEGDTFNIKFLKYIGTTTHKGVNGSSITMHTFEPYQMPDDK